MEETILSRSLALILGIGAIGIYWMLPLGLDVSRPFVRRVGAGLAGLSLVLLIVTVGTPVNWWPELKLASYATRSVFFVLASGSVLSAAMTITSRTASSSVQWFALMLVSNAGLFVFQGALFLAVATVLVYAASLAAAWLFLAGSTERRFNVADDGRSREPFLACFTGALLSLALVGTIHYALAVEAERTLAIEAQQVRRSHRLSAFPTLKSIESVMNERPRLPDFEKKSNVAGLGTALSGTHWVVLEVTAVLMLVTLIGAVLIVQRSRQTEYPKLKNREAQISTDEHG